MYCDELQRILEIGRKTIELLIISDHNSKIQLKYEAAKTNSYTKDVPKPYQMTFC